MRLAEPGRAADEERVVREAGHLGDGERGGVREAVGVADDELLERVARVERAPARCGSARADRARLGVVPGATSSTRTSGPEHGGGAACEQAPEALLDPGPDRVGRLDEERPVAQRAGGERLEPLVPGRLGDGPLQLGADRAPAGWVLVVGHRRVRSPPRREAGVERRWNKGPRGGPEGEHSTGPRARPEAIFGRVANRAEKVSGARRRAGGRAVDGCARRVHEPVDGHRALRAALRRAARRPRSPDGWLSCRPLRAPGAPTTYGS